MNTQSPDSVLELQREILRLTEAGDEEALATLAERRGIDPDLWRHSRELFAMAAEIESRVRTRLSEGE